MEETTKIKRPEIVGDDSLVLYCNQYSYYCQKVLWALAEKDIKFTKYEVDVANDEHFSEWFLELNPRGELPVLQKGLMIVPGSSRILDFLEEKFPESKSLKLPSTADKKLASLRTTLDKLPIGVLTVGSFLHPNSVVSPKSPFVQPVRYTILERDESVSSRLRSYAEAFPAFSNVLLKKDRFWTSGKKPALEKYFHRILSSNNFQSMLPTKTTLLKTIWLNTPSTYKAGIAAFSFSSMIIGSTLLKR